MILGIGIDIVEAPRFKAAVDRFGERLLNRLFTGQELGYCMRQRRPERHLSARFAAKVSLFKALGRGLSYRAVEVKRDESGRPSFESLELKGLRVSLSITHDGDLSLAQTIIEAE